MKISLKWLQDYVDVSEFLAEPEKLARQLTNAGIEVESVTDLGRQFASVVVGKIIELGKHPNADRLTLCQVDAGEGKLRQIVCGARNHRQGDKVVVALPGAVLPGDFAIKDSKIRDVESKGMLCSEKELGFKGESEGILILPADAPVGETFSSYYGLADVVFDLNVTPNRADCLSHLGLAREIGCVLGRDVKTPKVKLKASEAFTKKAIRLDVKEEELCPRYAGRSLRGVKVGPSPDWLRHRLAAVDLNSINNVVDVTNYVMMELGQPLHAFDLRFLEGHEIVVAKARPGEEFTTFDGSQLKLTGEELTIRDGKKAVALAGIVGGRNSGVQGDTTDIFIESAHFAADSVRRTARRLGVQTDSAYRFSRGTDPSSVALALDRACELLAEVAGAEIAKDHYDEYPHPIKHGSISITTDEVGERLGYSVSAKEFGQWMERLGCQVKSQAKKFVVTPPPYRWDLTQQADLVEELGRLKGYDLIPETFPSLTQTPLSHEAQYSLETQAVDVLVAEGYQQAINFGFVSSHFQARFLGQASGFAPGGLEVGANPVRLLNPLNEELDVMRVSLMPGLFKNALQNFRYGNEIGRLFELGPVFAQAPAASADENGFMQNFRLAMVVWGQKEGLWKQDQGRPIIFDLKASVENLLERLGIANYQWQFPDPVPSVFHPAQTAVLFCEGRTLGWLGALHPEKLEAEKIRGGMAIAEFDFAKLMRGQPRIPKAQRLARFPAVQRDLALVMPEALSTAEVIREIKKAAGPLLRSVEVFDVFRGGNLAAGHKSVAFRMTLQDFETTLTDDRIQSVHQEVLTKVSQKLNLHIR